jgi:hypothetical protein
MRENPALKLTAAHAPESLVRFEIRPRLKGSDLKYSPFPRAHTRELGAGAQRLDALKPGVTKTLVTSLVTKERAGFQRLVSNVVSTEPDVLPTVSSGPVSKAVSTQSGFKLALDCTMSPNPSAGFLLCACWWPA